MEPLHRSAVVIGLTVVAALATACDQPTAVTPRRIASEHVATLDDATSVQRVLLISVDGMHQSDLTRYVETHPQSTFAKLRRRGSSFVNASASKPSDSFPGLLAMITGGSPRSTGVFYDVSYDRTLSPPGSACKTIGTAVVYDESIEFNSNLSDGGGGIDPTTLPLDPSRGCTPVYPHQYLRVNTVFEVLHAAGRRTAWADKHFSYDLVNGPSGHGVDDLFTPEIVALLPNGETGETNAADAQTYDAIKVRAILNEIDGKDHSGTRPVGVPAIFGMNFQAVSVGQKTAGYADATGTPTAALASSFAFVDASLGQFVDELARRDLLNTTAIIISAKHGQTPINRALRRVVDDNLLTTVANSVASDLVAQVTADDIALFWLNDQSKAAAVADALVAQASVLGITSTLVGDDLRSLFNDPRKDARTPDVIGLPAAGVIYASPSAKKLAEHGGFHEEDIHVPLLVILPPGAGATLEGAAAGAAVSTPVTTAQIAPTILRLLGLDPDALKAVQLEGTEPLPITKSD
ncbi:MAG TPA: alkaline phosphatase family protein [Gemmatimonadales bacterium]|nr:alkaline phosphatase family protein [Gemmatimonadales bacterium]